jgi:hypothetical protein
VAELVWSGRHESHRRIVVASQAVCQAAPSGVQWVVYDKGGSVTKFDDLSYRWAERRLRLPAGSVVKLANSYLPGTAAWSDVTPGDDSYYEFSAITADGVRHSLGFIPFPLILDEMWKLEVQ